VRMMEGTPPGARRSSLPDSPSFSEVRSTSASPGDEEIYEALKAAGYLAYLPFDIPAGRLDICRIYFVNQRQLLLKPC
jgi:hypothetical protein